MQQPDSFKKRITLALAGPIGLIVGITLGVLGTILAVNIASLLFREFKGWESVRFLTVMPAGAILGYLFLKGCVAIALKRLGLSLPKPELNRVKIISMLALGALALFLTQVFCSAGDKVIFSATLDTFLIEMIPVYLLVILIVINCIYHA